MFKRSTKNIRIRKIFHTRTSWSKCMINISLDLVFNLIIYVMQVCLLFIPTQNSTQSLLEIWWKEGKTMPWWGSYTLSDWVNHLRNLYLFCKKLTKLPDRKLIKEWMISNSTKIVLFCNHARLGKAISPIGIKLKGWIKCQTYSNWEKILCYRHGTCELYSSL